MSRTRFEAIGKHFTTNDNGDPNDRLRYHHAAVRRGDLIAAGEQFATDKGGD
jgi:hypothetical protein